MRQHRNPYATTPKP
jgi:hypothetical protein